MAQNIKRQQPKQKSDAIHKSAPKTENQTRPAQAGPALPGVLQRAESDPGSLSPVEVGRLQNTVGNRSVGRLLRPAGGSRPAAGMAARLGPTVQAKLQVGPAVDRYEQEADRMAAEVLAMPAPQAAPAQPPVQRNPEEEDEVQALAEDPRAGFEAGADFEDQLRGQKGGGAPLPSGVRSFMEPRFGADFSGVRLHTGSESAQLNRAISAQAFTQGQDIFLAEGKENIESSAGRQLLAHELTHTIQQGAAPVRRQHAAGQTGAIQRHSESELEEQIATAAIEDEEHVQLKAAEGVQRHPIAPSVEVGHEAAFGERKTAEMQKIAANPVFIQKVRDAFSALVSSTLTGQDAATKQAQITSMQWQMDGDVAPANPAQVKGGNVKLYYYHPNWYLPNGNPRVEFIKSTVIHEGLHYISHAHEGFQSFTPEKLNTHSLGNLAGADTLDEAVTDRIGREVAVGVLGSTEAYTTNYWNLEARRGLDSHLTFQGLEMLAKGPAQLWLGEMVDIIIAETGLTWAEIKTAYLTDAVQDPQIKQKIDAKRPDVAAKWKAKSEAALQAQLGAHAVAKPTWDTQLKASAKEVNDELKTAPPEEKAKQSGEQIKDAVDKKIRARTGAPHEVVSTLDARSSSLDDWKVVRENTPDIDPDKGTKAAAWSESISQAKWGGAAGPNFKNTEALETQEALDNPHSRDWKGVAIPDVVLAEYIRKANLLLGKLASLYPMGWVIVPHDPKLPESQWIKAGDKFKTYPWAAVKLLQPDLLNQSLSSLTGANPATPARTVLSNMGGGGYEANGEFAALNYEHVNYATVIHEMGHHKQHKVHKFNEQTINQVKGLFPLLDLHNILISENRIAADELARKPASNPYVRLRYTEKPIRLRVNDWETLAANQTQEGGNYKRLKARLEVKGGKPLELLKDIERELTDVKNKALYPGNVPIMFKNMMVAEIMQKSGGAILRLEKDIDIGLK
jgi:hypothetical protein